MMYHGTSSECGIDYMLCPPETTGVLSEKGRKKNLGRVFYTEDLGLAKIYAGRACRQFGGKPVIFKVISPVNQECLSDKAGATVYHADWAFVEIVSI